VVLEAMASGLPVVTTDRNGAAEVVEPGRTGWIVPLAEARKALPEVLRELTGADLAAMGRAARGVAETWTLDRNVEETLAVYRRFARS